MSNHKKIIVCFDDNFTEMYSKIDLNSVPDDWHRSSLRVTNNLLKFLNAEDFAFYTPRTFLEHNKAFEVKNNRLELTNPNLSSDLFLILAVNTEEPDFCITKVAQQYAIYSDIQHKIGKFINPLSSKFLLDKRKLYDFEDIVALPKRYDFENWEDIQELLKNQESLILKHRMGAGGDQVYLINKENIGALQKKAFSLSEYILQENIDAAYEKRIYLLGEEIVGTHVLHNWNRPWHPAGEIREGFFAKSFEPTLQEKEKAVELHKKLNLDFGAVDLIETNQGKQYLLEVNGIFPGMVSYSYPEKGSIYDIGETFVKFIYNQIGKTQHNSKLPMRLEDKLVA